MPCLCTAAAGAVPAGLTGWRAAALMEQRHCCVTCDTYAAFSLILASIVDPDIDCVSDTSSCAQALVQAEGHYLEAEAPPGGPPGGPEAEPVFAEQKLQALQAEAKYLHNAVISSLKQPQLIRWGCHVVCIQVFAFISAFTFIRDGAIQLLTRRGIRTR